VQTGWLVGVPRRHAEGRRHGGMPSGHSAERQTMRRALRGPGRAACPRASACAGSREGVQFALGGCHTPRRHVLVNSSATKPSDSKHDPKQSLPLSVPLHKVSQAPPVGADTLIAPQAANEGRGGGSRGSKRAARGALGRGAPRPRGAWCEQHRPAVGPRWPCSKARSRCQRGPARHSRAAALGPCRQRERGGLAARPGLRHRSVEPGTHARSRRLTEGGAGSIDRLPQAEAAG
jgi:hypothetical protein